MQGHGSFKNFGEVKTGEVLSNKDLSKNAAMGNGVPGCVGCHTPSPKDMVLIPFPFK